MYCEIFTQPKKKVTFISELDPFSLLRYVAEEAQLVA